jgi:hypothetical protein
VSSTLEPLSGAHRSAQTKCAKNSGHYLQRCSAACLSRLQTTCTGGLRAWAIRVAGCAPRPAPHGHAGVSASPQLTFQRDHSMQAGQSTTSDLDRPMLIGENTRRRRHTSAELPAPSNCAYHGSPPPGCGHRASLDSLLLISVSIESAKHSANLPFP